MAFIYALIDSRCPDEYRYIGKTIKTIAHRLYMHKYKANRDLNLHKVRWMNLVEMEGGEVIAVELEQCEDHKQDEREMYWIRKCRDDGHRITNMSDGGEGGVNPCPEVIEKIANALRGRKRPEHVVEALRANGRKYVGSANPNYGKTHTEEAKRRIVAKRVGVPLTSEHKRKLAEDSSKTKLTPEQAAEIYRLAVVVKMKHKEIAALFPVTTKAVSHIATGQRWKHLNLKERFASC